MSKSVELTIQFPDSLEASEELLQLARTAAESALGEVLALEAVAEDLRSRGIAITAAELLARKVGTKRSTGKRGPRGPHKPRLTAEEKNAIVEALRSGTQASALAEQYERSLGTIMGLKRKAGLTRPRR